MNRHGKLILIGLFLAILAGCALNQDIRYNFNDITLSGATELKDVTLNVELFNDNRRSVAESAIVFIDGRETKINGKRVCINSERHYSKEPVAKQITMVVSSHLRQRGAFKNVLVDAKDSADFQLLGSIRQFYSQKDFSYTAAVGSQLGLVGAILTMGATTRDVVRIDFVDLKLVDKNGNVVKTLKNVTKTFEDESYADAYCWQVFRNANAKLREVVDFLADDVERSLIDILRKKTVEQKD